MLTHDYLECNHYGGLKAMAESVGSGSSSTTDTRIADLDRLQKDNQEFQTAMTEVNVNMNQQNAVARTGNKVGGQ
jgi:hypothetical protein